MSGKIKISEKKTDGNINAPRFTLTLDQKGTDEQKRNDSYAVLSKLAGNSDVIVGLDSSLQNLPSEKREAYAEKFLGSVRELGLEYKCGKIASSATPSFFSFLFGTRNQQAQEILVYVPNEVWGTEEFKKIIPLYGARYFIAKGKEEGPKLLDDLQKMLDREKIEYFKLVVFSAVVYASMGIMSNTLSLTDLKGILGE